MIDNAGMVGIDIVLCNPLDLIYPLRPFKEHSPEKHDLPTQYDNTWVGIIGGCSGEHHGIVMHVCRGRYGFSNSRDIVSKCIFINVGRFTAAQATCMGALMYHPDLRGHGVWQTKNPANDVA